MELVSLRCQDHTWNGMTVQRTTMQRNHSPNICSMRYLADCTKYFFIQFTLFASIMTMGAEDVVTIAPHFCGLLSGDTKPLPEPKSIYHQKGSVTFMWQQFHEKYLSQHSLKLLKTCVSKIVFKSPRGQRINIDCRIHAYRIDAEDEHISFYAKNLIKHADLYSKWFSHFPTCLN